jgi:small-conductance mechanosensitive channel
MGRHNGLAPCEDDVNLYLGGHIWSAILPADIQHLFNFELFRLPSQPVTIFTAVMAVVVLIGSYLLARFTRAGLRRIRLRTANGGHGSSTLYLAEGIVFYTICITGWFVALSTIGFQLGQISLFAGALGVGIGLGMQDITRDFIGGIILVLDKSLDVGDFIEIENGVTGEIQEIGARATRIRTNDNVVILVPNSSLMSGKVTNWTHGNTTRRVHIPFTVMFNADKEDVRKAAFEAAKTVPFTLPDDGARVRTQVWLVGFAENGLKFELVVWPSLDAVKRPSAMYAAYYWALDDALRKAKIEMPYPQLDLRMRTLFGQEGRAALAAAGMRAATAAPAAERHSLTTHNDAAADLMAGAAADAENKPPAQ